MQPSTPTNYRAFLEAKLTLSRHSGFTVPPNPSIPCSNPTSATLFVGLCLVAAGRFLVKRASGIRRQVALLKDVPATDIRQIVVITH